MVKWEYFIHGIPRDTNMTLDAMNALGADGWELCFWDGGEQFVFKRRIIPPATPSREIGE